MIKVRGVFCGLLIAVAFVYFVIAAHDLALNVASIDEDNEIFFNLSVNNTDAGQLANITQVNITLPSNFTFVSGTNGSDVLVYSFLNTSNVLSWTNTSEYLINGSEVKNFWFNASSATPGNYNFTITSVNGTDIIIQNLSIQVNDSFIPFIYVSPSDADNSNISRNYIVVNVSADNDAEVDKIEIRLYNSSGTINNTNVSSSFNSNSANYFVNFTGLGQGVYYFNASVNNSLYTNYTLTRTVRIDTAKPIIDDVESDPSSNSVRITWDTNELANSSINLGDSTSLGDDSNSSATMKTSHSLKIFGLDPSDVYYFNVTSCDFASNCNTTGPYNFTTDAASSSSSSSSSSSGGGSLIITVKTLNESEFKSGYTQGLIPNQRIKFDVNNSNHYATLVKLTIDTATISISSNPQQADFKKGDSKKFDVNNDSYYDVEVKLNEIRNGLANVTIIGINELIAGNVVVNLNTTSNKSANDDKQTEKGFEFFEGVSDWVWIAVIVLVVIVMITIVYWNMYGNPFKRVNEYYATKKLMRM